MEGEKKVLVKGEANTRVLYDCWKIPTLDRMCGCGLAQRHIVVSRMKWLNDSRQPSPSSRIRRKLQHHCKHAEELERFCYIVMLINFLALIFVVYYYVYRFVSFLVKIRDVLYLRIILESQKTSPVTL